MEVRVGDERPATLLDVALAGSRGLVAARADDMVPAPHGPLRFLWAAPTAWCFTGGLGVGDAQPATLVRYDRRAPEEIAWRLVGSARVGSWSAQEFENATLDARVWVAPDLPCPVQVDMPADLLPGGARVRATLQHADIGTTPLVPSASAAAPLPPLPRQDAGPFDAPRDGRDADGFPLDDALRVAQGDAATRQFAAAHASVVLVKATESHVPTTAEDFLDWDLHLGGSDGACWMTRVVRTTMLGVAQTQQDKVSSSGLEACPAPAAWGAPSAAPPATLAGAQEWFAMLLPHEDPVGLELLRVGGTWQASVEYAISQDETCGLGACSAAVVPGRLTFDLREGLLIQFSGPADRWDGS